MTNPNSLFCTNQTPFVTGSKRTLNDVSCSSMSVISYGMNADSGRVADALIIHTAIRRQRTKASYSRPQPNNQSSHKQLLRPQMGERVVRESPGMRWRYLRAVRQRSRQNFLLFLVNSAVAVSNGVVVERERAPAGNLHGLNSADDLVLSICRPTTSP